MSDTGYISRKDAKQRHEESKKDKPTLVKSRKQNTRWDGSIYLLATLLGSSMTLNVVFLLKFLKVV